MEKRTNEKVDLSVAGLMKEITAFKHTISDKEYIISTMTTKQTNNKNKINSLKQQTKQVRKELFILV